ncbi:MAG: hypothetical protein HON90_14510 [Halobacteriovoraceae bacterium]|jgi:hypothetical protein|nr:hypothetical protein [Halobacteriovoraceae bacterium]
MKKLLLGGLFCLSFSSYAVTVSVTHNPATDCPGTMTTVQCTALVAEVNSFVNADMPDVSIDKYGTGVANASGFAYKGLGSDYSDNFDIFMVRVGGGLAVQGDLETPESAEGVGFGAAATIGINLDLLPINKVGPIDLSKMDLFVSFMSYDTEQDLDSGTGEFDISHFGLMARYHLIDSISFIPGGVLKWGGIFLHTGLQRSSMKAKLSQTFENETVDVSGGFTADLVNTSAVFTLESTNTTIPVEVSTYLQAAYVFTFFGGLGFDLVTGGTDVDLTAGGTAQGSTGPTSGFQATITANESSSGDADATNFRGFVGAQFNIPFFKIYAQMNKGLGNDQIGVNLGAKILW